MTRKISVSAPPPPPGDGATSDWGRWLTRDLRAKGDPRSLAPSSASSPPPSAKERERAELVGWLVSGLSPKHARRPSVAPASLPPAAPDSLAPQALAAGLPPSEPPGARELDDEDLRVLPGRRRAGAAATRRRVAVMLGAALLAGALLLGLRARGPAASLGVAASAARPDLSAALPPPPPADLPPGEAELWPSAQRARGAAGDDPASALQDPRSLLNGLAVRRYADIPSRTLSRLAREQRERARARDEAARAAAGLPPARAPGGD